MKEEHQDKLAELLIGYTEKAGETTGTIVEWLQIQAPELCSEIIAYNMVFSACGVFFGVVILLLSLGGGAWGLIKLQDVDKLFMLFVMLPIMAGICILESSFPTLIKCYFAPKLFLLEYMKGFM